MIQRLLAGLLVLAVVACAQQRVDPTNTYHRILCVVPLTGAGTEADPVRPQYAPTPAALAAASPAASATASQSPSAATPPTAAAPAIIGYMQLPSDDKRFALVEYVARDMAAFKSILSDKSIKVFIKGVDSRSSIEQEFRKYRKDFNLDKFGVVMP